MTAIELRSDHLLPEARTPHQEVAWWAMVLFCMNEGALFAYFIASYFYVGLGNRFWPPMGIDRPALRLPLIMTALLLSSSVVLWLAERGRERGARLRYRLLTGLTLLLGLGFLYLQGREYREKLHHFTPQTHAYTSLFFTITGFHGAHVAFGLLLIAWALLRDLRGRVDPAKPLAITVTSLYWHFVDGVWLVILLSLYLSPRFYTS